MPSSLPFDLYDALEVTSSASISEITSSYRRLAREHHPDKNPDNPEATVKKQKINAAYEVLSNERLRADYDTTSSSPSSRSSRSGWDHDAANSEQYYYEDNEEVFDDFVYENLFGFSGFSYGGYSSGFGHYPGYGRGPSPAELQRMAEKMAEGAKRREEIRKKFNEQLAKEAAERAERKAEADRKKEEQARKVEEKEKKFQAEREHQEEIWQCQTAITAAEKRASCLHSEFWPRQQMKSKFKCAGCTKRRGPTAFKCPHCSTLHCQACLNDFHAKRVTH